MDKYDLKLKKYYAEMREQEQRIIQKKTYICVPTNDSEEKQSLEQGEPLPQLEPISMVQITQTLESMIKVIRTQEKRINDLEKILHGD